MYGGRVVDLPKKSVFPGFAELESSANDLGHMLARRRKWLHLSQSDVAKKMGTSQSAIARLEAGGTDVRVSTLVRYAEALGCTLAIELNE